MTADLPHCDALFARYFLPFYSDSDAERYQFGELTRPDMMSFECENGTIASELSSLTDDGQKVISDHIDTMTEAAFSDFKRSLGLSGKPSIAWLQVIDEHYNKSVIASLIENSDPSEDSNDYKIVCIEFGLLVAHILKERCPQLRWIADSPYWESSLFHEPTQNVIPPVHWGIKKMSDYGWDDGFVEKCEMCVDLLSRETEPTT